MRSFDCPTCGQVLNITGRKEGQIVKCEFCKTPAKVVRLGAPESTASTASTAIPPPPPPGLPVPVMTVDEVWGLTAEPAPRPEGTRRRRDSTEPEEPDLDRPYLAAIRLLLILHELRTIKALLIVIAVGLALWCVMWMSHQGDVEDLLRAIRVIRAPVR